MDKLKRIKKERAKLTKLFENVPENKKTLIAPLIENAAFMRVTLDELQSTINANGCSEEYQNGANQYGRKSSADLQAYNSTMKMYASVIDKLDKMLPEDAGVSRLALMMNE